MTMTAEQNAAKILTETGRKQSWLVDRMNSINPAIKMSCSKMSETLRGKREMTADELVAFCIATETKPQQLIGA